MNQTNFCAIIFLYVATLTASAQSGVRMPEPYAQLNKAQQRGLNQQAANIFNAAKPAVKKAAKSTVSIYVRNKRVAFGTAVRTKNAQTALLTKWSEIANASANNPLTIVAANGQSYPATVAGVYKEHDLALLKTNAPLNPLDIRTKTAPELGHIIALAHPDATVEGIGVISVLARSLREKDKAYLGVMMDFKQAGKKGVPLTRVMPGSAAMKAGLRDGDIIFSVDKNPVTGPVEMRNILQRLQPGSSINVEYRREGAEKQTTVKLGSRGDNSNIRRVPQARMERMQRMGTAINNQRSNFPSVIQSDMAIDPNDMGAPVVDLDGQTVGITIARASRIKTFIIPTETLIKTLAFDPLTPEQALSAMRQSEKQRRSTANNNRRNPAPLDDPAARVRRLLGEIEKNNRQNDDILREVEEQLRRLEQAEKNR